MVCDKKSEFICDIEEGQTIPSLQDVTKLMHKSKNSSCWLLLRCIHDVERDNVDFGNSY